MKTEDQISQTRETAQRLEKISKGAGMKDAIDFLDRIEGHGYGGMADYEVARTTVQDAKDLLIEARLQIEYLHGKFQETCSGNAVLARINALVCADEQATPISKEASDLLAKVVGTEAWGVVAAEIVAGAELLKAGFARAEDDYEGPILYPEKPGIDYAHSVDGQKAANE